MLISETGRNLGLIFLSRVLGLYLLSQTTNNMKKTLIIFRLFDRTYGPQGNPKTLAVYLRPDNTLGYSFYGGWQNSGTGFSIENLQMSRSLPLGVRQYKGKVERLVKEIKVCLASGYGSNDLHSFEILNDL